MANGGGRGTKSYLALDPFAFRLSPVALPPLWDQAIPQRLEEQVHVDGFREDGADTRLFDGASMFVGCDTRQDDHGKLELPLLLPQPNPFGAIAVGQRDIENDDFRSPVARDAFCLRERARLLDFVALRLEKALQSVTGRRVVLDDQDAPGMPRRVESLRRRPLAPSLDDGLFGRFGKLRQRQRNAGSLPLSTVEQEISSHQLD